MSLLDLRAYFARIHWKGELRHDLPTLTGLLRAHMSRIPFENLDVLLGRPIRLDLASVQDKLVRQKRGGYCFEQATLLAAVLEELRFQRVCHAARVILAMPASQAPRNHMFVTVSLPEGRFVLDPGFGGQSPRAPLPLLAGPETRVDCERHWLTQDVGGNRRDWVLRADVRNGEVACWVSNFESESPADLELSNHFTSTHPSSAFVNRLMLSALTPRGRVSVMNRDLTLWFEDGPQKLQLADRSALRSALVEHFGIDLDVSRLRVPSIPEWS